MTEPDLGDVKYTIQKLDNSLIHLVTELAEIKSDVQLIRTTLYGNGARDGGMIGRQNSIDKWIEGQVWFQRLIVGLLAGEAIGILYIVAKHVLGSP